MHRYERHTDIRIDHLNGYLPQGIESTAKIVFSPRSFDEHQAKKGQGDMINEWFVDSCLGNKLLFIGVSGDDQIMTINTKRIRNVYARFGVIEDSVAGYALLSESAYTKNRAKFLDGNIMPIQVDANDIPKYLLNICKLASQREIRQK